MDSVARSVVVRHLDREVRATEAATYGNFKRTVFVTLVDGEVVVVQYAPDEGTGAFATETALWRAVDDRTEVPVPDILATGEIRHPETDEPLAYVVSERVEGRDLHVAFTALDTAHRRTVTRRLGRLLGALHEAFPFEGYGDVVVTDVGLRVAEPTTDWGAWFDGYLERGLAAFGSELADLVPEIRAAVDSSTLPEHPPAVLFPWDFRPGNALLGEDGGVAALLDWGAPLAAAPGLSFAKAAYLVGDWYAPEAPETRADLRTAFREGYATHRPVPTVPRAYRLAAVVRSAYDSRGEVTRPSYPERTGERAVQFHRQRLRGLLDG